MFPLVFVALMNLPLHMTLYLEGGYWAQPIPNYSDTQVDIDPVIPPTLREQPVDPMSFDVPFTPPWAPTFNPAKAIPNCNCPPPERIERRA
jgi:hypothetical protein